MADIVNKWIADLQPGDKVWIQVEVTNTEFNGTEDDYVDIKWLVDARDDDYNSGMLYVNALDHMHNVDSAPKPGELVYVQGSPSAVGRLVTVIKGQAVIDWSYELPTSPAAISNISIGVVRRADDLS